MGRTFPMVPAAKTEIRCLSIPGMGLEERIGINVSELAKWDCHCCTASPMSEDKKTGGELLEMWLVSAEQNLIIPEEPVPGSPVDFTTGTVFKS